MDIKEAKSYIGNSAQYIIANGLFMESKGKKYRCPKYSQHKNQDEHFSMSWHEDGLRFNCFACNETIDIYDYYTKYKGMSHEEAMEAMGDRRTIPAPTPVKEEPQKSFYEEIKLIEKLDDKAFEHFKQRNITRETVEQLRIGMYKGSIAYPYFNEHNNIIGVKLRRQKIDIDKSQRFWSISGSQFSLFNKINVPKEEKEILIVTEGEIDCSTLWQIGYRNVVSIGCGANSVEDMVKKENAYLKKFRFIIIASDDDDSGRNMDNLFINHFGEAAKTLNKSLYHGLNDINALYINKGEKAVRELIKSAELRIEGEYDPSEESYDEIIKVNTGKFIPTGMPTIDRDLNQLRPGFVTLITGRSNDGKSTFTAQLIANAIESGASVYWVSGEETKDLLMDKLFSILLGKEPKYYVTVKENLDYIKKPTREAYVAITRWYKNKLKIFVKGDSRLKTVEELLEMIEKQIKINQYDLTVIDNLMSVLSATAAEKFVKQAEFMQRLHDIASTSNKHIILVLHPNKEHRAGQDMAFEEISGAGELSQKADNIIFVRKSHNEDDVKNGIHGYIKVLKNRRKPKLPRIKTNYDFDTNCLYEIDEETSKPVKFEFTWKKHLDKELNFYNGTKQVVEEGKGYKPEIPF